MKQWVKLFNKYDLYTKEDIEVDTQKLKKYYGGLFKKFFHVENYHKKIFLDLVQTFQKSGFTRTCSILKMALNGIQNNMNMKVKKRQSELNELQALD